MATDFNQLRRSLRDFYDFTGKVILLVGAGTGQLLDPSIRPKQLIAIDPDLDALTAFEARVAANGMQDFVDVVHGRFEEVVLSGDVVYFEFCLHEIEDPSEALKHARTLAPDILIFDHAADSPWSYYAAEDDKVRRSDAAIRHLGPRRRRQFAAEQHFANLPELLAKLASQGETAIARAQHDFASSGKLAIQMPCELVLI
jgi:Methyltransferase domain